jgi:hypothetical protein
MKNLTTTNCLTLTILLGVTGLSASADLLKGLTVDESGDYATALRELKPLVEQEFSGAKSL